jgi:hypothetical protein
VVRPTSNIAQMVKKNANRSLSKKSVDQANELVIFQRQNKELASA